MTRTIALSLWSVLAVCVGTGCFPINVSAVEQEITTGDRLRAIEVRRNAVTQAGPPRPSDARAPSAAELAFLRECLLLEPPSFRAEIARRGGDQPIASYSEWSPSLYQSVDLEVRDLARARDAGVISVQEFEDFSTLARDQARRTIVRHRTGGTWSDDRFLADSIHTSIFGGSYGTQWSVEACERRARQWVDSSINRLRGQWTHRGETVETAKPGAVPSASGPRSWADYWIDPMLPTPAPTTSPAAPSPPPAPAAP